MSEHKQREDRLTRLEQRLEQLEKISDMNAAAFSDSLHRAEICIQALQRVIDDNLNDCLVTTELEPAGTCLIEGIDQNGAAVQEEVKMPPMRGVDFKSYLQQALDAYMAASKAEMVPASSVGADEQVAFEFGG